MSRGLLRGPRFRGPAGARGGAGAGSGGGAGSGAGASADAPPSSSGPLAGSGTADTPVGGSSAPAFLDDTSIEDGRNGQPAAGGKLALLIQYANQLAYQGKPLFSFVGAKADANNEQPWNDADGAPLLRQIYGGQNYGAVKEGAAIQYQLSTGGFSLRFNDTSYSAAGTSQFEQVLRNSTYPTGLVTGTLVGTRGYVATNSELAVSSEHPEAGGHTGAHPFTDFGGGILRSGVVWQEPQTMIDASLEGTFTDQTGTVTGKNAYISLRGVQQGLPIVGVRSGNLDSAETLRQLRVSLINAYQFRRGQVGWCAQAVEADAKYVDFNTSSQNFRYIFKQSYGAGGLAHAVDAPALTLPLLYSAAGISTQIRCYVFVYARMSGGTDTGSIGIANRDASGVMATSASALTNPVTISGTTWKWYPDKLSATTSRFNPATAPYFLGYAGATSPAYDRVALCAKSSGATNTVQIAAFTIMPIGDGDFTSLA